MIGCVRFERFQRMYTYSHHTTWVTNLALRSTRVHRISAEDVIRVIILIANRYIIAAATTPPSPASRPATPRHALYSRMTNYGRTSVSHREQEETTNTTTPLMKKKSQREILEIPTEAAISSSATRRRLYKGLSLIEATVWSTPSINIFTFVKVNIPQLLILSFPCWHSLSFASSAAFLTFFFESFFPIFLVLSSFQPFESRFRLLLPFPPYAAVLYPSSDHSGTGFLNRKGNWAPSAYQKSVIFYRAKTLILNVLYWLIVAS